MIQVPDTDEYDDVQEKGCNASPKNPTMIEELGTRNVESDCAESSLPMSSPRTKISNSEDRVKRPSKRGRKARESKQKKRAKRTTSEVPGIDIESQNVAGEIVQEKRFENNRNLLYSMEKTCEKGKKVKFATVVSELPASLDQKASSGKIPKFKKPAKGTRKSIDHQLNGCSVRSKSRYLDSAKNDKMTQSQSNEEYVSQTPTIPFSMVHDKNNPNLGVKTRKTEMVTTHPKCNRELRSLKRPKISIDNIAKDKLVGCVQGGLNKVLSKSSEVQRKKETSVPDKSVGMEKALPDSNVEVVRKCKTVLNKVQCAFCHSTEDSQVSLMLCLIGGKNGMVGRGIPKG